MADAVGTLKIMVTGSAVGFTKAMKSTRVPIRATATSIKRLGRSISAMSRRALIPLKMLRRQFQRLWVSIRGVLRIMGGPLGRIGWFGGLGGLGAGVLGVSFAVKAAAEYEMASIAFDVMIGNAKLAKKTLKDLAEFSARTPFQFPDILVASKQLLAFGISANQLLPTLRVLGDVSSGLSIPLKELAWLYGQTKVEQRLYARDLRQFTTRGIPLITELAKIFSIAESKIRDLVAAGKVGFRHVQKALVALTGPAGRFYKLTELTSLSLEGLWSTLKDTMWFVMKDVGMKIAEQFGFKDIAKNLITNMRVARGPIVDLIMAIVTPLWDLAKGFGKLLLSALSMVMAVIVKLDAAIGKMMGKIFPKEKSTWWSKTLVSLGLAAPALLDIAKANVSLQRSAQMDIAKALTGGKPGREIFSLSRSAVRKAVKAAVPADAYEQIIGPLIANIFAGRPPMSQIPTAAGREYRITRDALQDMLEEHIGWKGGGALWKPTTPVQGFAGAMGKMFGKEGYWTKFSIALQDAWAALSGKKEFKLGGGDIGGLEIEPGPRGRKGEMLPLSRMFAKMQPAIEYGTAAAYRAIWRSGGTLQGTGAVWNEIKRRIALTNEELKRQTALLRKQQVPIPATIAP